MGDAPKTLADVKAQLVEAVAVVDQLLAARDDAGQTQVTNPTPDDTPEQTEAPTGGEPTPPTE